MSVTLANSRSKDDIFLGAAIQVGKSIETVFLQ
jgi:hypothetical protein